MHIGLSLHCLALPHGNNMLQHRNSLWCIISLTSFKSLQVDCYTEVKWSEQLAGWEENLVVYMIRSKLDCFSKPWWSLMCHSLFCVCHWKINHLLSQRWVQVPPRIHVGTLAMSWRTDAHPHSHLFFPSALRKCVGQKGAEVARKVREMSETLPTF